MSFTRQDETRKVAGRELQFFTVPVGSGRWVFGGCRNAGGYATIEDAMVEAEGQLTGKLQGRLAMESGQPWAKAKDHNAYWRTVIEPLTSQGW